MITPLPAIASHHGTGDFYSQVYPDSLLSRVAHGNIVFAHRAILSPVNAADAPIHRSILERVLECELCPPLDDALVELQQVDQQKYSASLVMRRVEFLLRLRPYPGRIQQFYGPCLLDTTAGAGPDIFANRGGQLGQRFDRNLETDKAQGSQQDVGISYVVLEDFETLPALHNGVLVHLDGNLLASFVVVGSLVLVVG